MKVIEYIELTSILKDDFWRLVNREVSAGLVQLRSDEIDELLELVQLTKWAKAQVGTFSTGMKQKNEHNKSASQHAESTVS
jgi:ABC-type multidrug transport system ATPase subunit